MTAIDRANNIYIEAVTSGTPKKGDVIKKLTGKFTDDAFIVTDEHHSYKDFTRKNHLQHIIIESGKHIKQSFSLARVLPFYICVSSSLTPAKCTKGNCMTI